MKRVVIVDKNFSGGSGNKFISRSSFSRVGENIELSVDLLNACLSGMGIRVEIVSLSAAVQPA